jgi:hypothetical protein
VRNLLNWIHNHTRPKTPRVEVIELEKPIPVQRDDDSAAIASLRGHPGIIALLNRLRLQQAVLETKLRTTRYKELADVYLDQSCLLGSRTTQLEIAAATQNLDEKSRPRVATFNEIDQFERIKNAIQSVRPTD